MKQTTVTVGVTLGLGALLAAVLWPSDRAAGRAEGIAIRPLQPLQVGLGDVSTVSLELSNFTKQDLDIREVTTSCGCIRIPDIAKQVPAGSSIKFEVTLDGREIGGVGSKQTISIQPAQGDTVSFVADVLVVPISPGYPYDARFKVVDGLARMPIDEVYADRIASISAIPSGSLDPSEEVVFVYDPQRREAVIPEPEFARMAEDSDRPWEILVRFVERDEPAWSAPLIVSRS